MRGRGAHRILLCRANEFLGRHCELQRSNPVLRRRSGWLRRCTLRNDDYPGLDWSGRSGGIPFSDRPTFPSLGGNGGDLRGVGLGAVYCAHAWLGSEFFRSSVEKTEDNPLFVAKDICVVNGTVETDRRVFRSLRIGHSRCRDGHSYASVGNKVFSFAGFGFRDFLWVHLWGLEDKGGIEEQFGFTGNYDVPCRR